MFTQFASLIESLEMDHNVYMFKRYPKSFIAEDAVATLMIRWRLNREEAMTLCQRYIDSRMIYMSVDKSEQTFRTRQGYLYSLTSKGKAILKDYRAKAGSSEILEDSKLIYLDRTDSGSIVSSYSMMETIFRRCAGTEPNSNEISEDKPRSLTESLVIKDRKHHFNTYSQAFYGSDAIDWLMDHTAIFTREEGIFIASHFLQVGWIKHILDNERGFKDTKASLYQLTDLGKKIAKWSAEGENLAPNPSGLSIPMRRASFSNSSGNLSEAARSLTINRNWTGSGNKLYRADSTEGSLSSENLVELGKQKTDTLPLKSLRRKTMDIINRMNDAEESHTPKELILPSLAELAKESTSNRLKQVMENVPLRLQFRAHLKDVLICEENFFFWMDVDYYRSLYYDPDKPLFTGQSKGGKKSKPYMLVPHAIGIYLKYIAPKSPYELNIPTTTRRDIVSIFEKAQQYWDIINLEGLKEDQLINVNKLLYDTVESEQVPLPNMVANFSPQMFNHAQNNIFRLMATDSIPKFIRTDIFRETYAILSSQGKLYVPPENPNNSALAAACTSVNQPVPDFALSMVGMTVFDLEPSPLFQNRSGPYSSSSDSQQTRIGTPPAVIINGILGTS